MLTDAAIRAARPRERPYKLTDGAGLHLYVTPAGGKLWRMRYELGGRERLLSFGPYPRVGLAEARGRRDAAKAALREGRDPGLAGRLRRAGGPGAAASTFEAVARDWHARRAPAWTARHAADVLDRTVSGRTKANALHELLPWNWKAARVAPAAA